MTTRTRHADGKTWEVEFLTTANTSKLIRKALKGAFPGVKFSVRSKSYSGGSSARVWWTDGPTTVEVDHVVGRFAGATFDGMTDCKNYVEGEYGGRPVMFGPDFVFTSRSNTEEALRAALGTLYAYHNIDEEEFPKPEVVTTAHGAVSLEGGDHFYGGEWLHQLVYRQAAAFSIGGPYPGVEGYEDDASIFETEEEVPESIVAAREAEPVEIPEGMFPDPTTPKEVLQAVGGILSPEGWSLKIDDRGLGEESHPYYYLEHPSTGATVFVHLDSQSWDTKWTSLFADDPKKVRFEVSASWPKKYSPPYEERTSGEWKISVDVKRGPKGIAADVNRRLLEKLLERWPAVVEAVRAEEERIEKLEAFRTMVAEAIGGTPYQHDSYVVSVFLSSDDARTVSGEIRVSPPSTFDIKNLTGIPIKQGLEILKILRTCGEPREVVG